ncbi:gamma-glutamyl-gamma-aminobutyrate hydrolase family protein [Candidatus Woesearchaeota archaeon]|nr:gamma-glutamyl-gamma-aminobutyrate hydrolase family protein [Candidatus Woesearchaeota archaeon]
MRSVLIIDLNEMGLSSLEFVRPVEAIVRRAGLSPVQRKVRDVVEADWSSVAAVILSGTPLMDNAFLEEESVNRLAWLKTFKQPVLGICAGMEAIAAVFGGELEEKKEIGMKNIRTTRKNKLFKGEFEAYCLHRKAISRQGDWLKDFDILAESDACIEAIKHKDREVYGVMFHPEVRNQEMIERFLKQ